MGYMRTYTTNLTAYTVDDDGIILTDMELVIST